MLAEEQKHPSLKAFDEVKQQSEVDPDLLSTVIT